MALPAAARSTAQTTWVYDCKNRQKMNSADQKSMMPSKNIKPFFLTKNMKSALNY